MVNHLYDIFKHWTYVDGLHKNSVYLIGDPHFGDEEMKTLRTNYISDDEQVKRINSKVGRNDTIVFLGDIGDLEFIKKIKGYKVLIMGNHDKGASNYKRTYQTGHLEPLENGGNLYVTDTEDNHLFDEVYEGPLMINDRVILSHEPIFPTIPFLFNIHGHVHNKNYKGDDHHLNVCAEAIDYTPINLINFIKSGNISHIDSIHRLTIDGAVKRKNKNK